MFHFTATPPLSLYLHIPWCVRKCPYCDFNSHEARGDIPEAGYIAALLADLEQQLPSVWGRTVESVFIGGGTPSLFSAHGIEQLLNELRARITLKPGAEITLEANPGTVDQARFTGFRQAGINRLSMGIQSFQDTLLTAIGRIHDGREARTAFEAARHAGFENINLDLMFGLPGQSTALAMQDLEQAIALRPEHLSWYELTIEPNTWFYQHPPTRPDDATRWTMQTEGQTRLEQAGYHRYEVSAFATDGRQCRHNLNYWQFGDYLGIGAGAHAKISDAAGQSITRTARLRHPRRYIDAAATAKCIDVTTTLSPGDAILEYIMNGLRLDAGFSAGEFTASTGLPYAMIEARIRQALQANWLVLEDERIRTTDRGQRYLDEFLQQWLPESSRHAETY